MNSKILSIVGARPQFIKYAPLSLALKEANYTDICIHTGQHYDTKMSQIFFDELKISRPKYNLSIGSDSHGKQTGQMLSGIEEIILTENPDAVIVFGDTNSTLAGALAASKLGVKLIHIEAGLRSFNKNMPEEINRILTDHVSDVLFAPTDEALANLKNEGIVDNVYITGDLMIDTQRIGLEFIESNENQFDFLKSSNPYLLCTIHRNYNTDDANRLQSIISSLNQLSHQVIFPIHPRTSNILKKEGYNISDYSNIKFIEPQGYFDFLYLLKNSVGIITDSGGLQKEAYNLKKPCITLRFETEWVETLAGNWNILIGNEFSTIEKSLAVMKQRYHDDIYGDGYAGKEIVKLMDQCL